MRNTATKRMNVHFFDATYASNVTVPYLSILLQLKYDIWLSQNLLNQIIRITNNDNINTLYFNCTFIYINVCIYQAPKLIQSMTKACLIKQMSTALETSYVYLGLVLSNCVQWCTAYTF